MFVKATGFFGILTVLFFIFSSCSDDNSMKKNENKYYFNESEFLKAKANWNSYSMKNYSFDYSISDVKPNSIRGRVSVLNGIGSVDLTVSGLTKDDDLFDSECLRYKALGKKIEFINIDEIFEFIEELVKKRKIQTETEELSYYKMDIKYNEKHIPASISETILEVENSNSPKIDGDWHDEFYMKIFNFSENLDD